MSLTTTEVQKLYLAYFGRPADPAGLTFWTSGNATLQQVSNAFSTSTEYLSTFAGLNNDAIVNAIYQNAFGHAPEAAASLRFWSDAISNGTLSVGDAARQIVNNTGVSDTAIVAAKGTAAAAFTTQVGSTVANTLGYVGASAVASAKAWLLTVVDTTTATAAIVPATLAATVTSVTVGGNVGTTFTLTTATDNITGTGGNDTIIGEFATSPANTLNASDQINGGAGTDTLKLFGTFNAAQLPVSITNVEVLDVVVAADAALDFSAYTKAVSGIETVKIENAALINGRAITTTTGQALNLATGAAGTATAGTVTWAASATDTSLNLTLNGYQGGTGVTPVALTITGAAATTQNIASTGAANKVSTLTLGALTNKVVVTGDQALTVSTNLVSSGGATVLKTVDASANTGGVSITLAATENAAFAFTGGTGNDSITFADNGLGALTSGSQLNGGAGTADKIGIFDTALSTAEFAAINAATNFEVLGLNAALSLDASTLTTIKSFSLDTNAAQSITNIATGATVSITTGHAANISLAGATGVNDLTLNIGKSSSTGLTVGGTVTVAETAVALTSNGTNAAANTIATLANADNSVYTLTGSNDLTITNALAGTAVGSKVDASGFTGKLNVTGSALSDILIGGSAADTLNAGLQTAAVTGVTAVAEVATMTGAGALTAGQVYTVAGLTYTDNGGGTSQAQLLSAFASLAVGATTGAGTGTGAYSGALTGYSTGAVTANVVTFTSSTAAAVADLTDSGTGAAGAVIAVTTQGVTAVTAVAQSVDTLTGNAGADIFAFSSTDIGTTAGVVTAKITDFVTGSDTIRSTVIAAAGTAANYVEATSAAADLATLLTAADTALNGTVKYYVGQVGSDSYLVMDNNGTGYTDVIQLTGVALTGIALADIAA